MPYKDKDVTAKERMKRYRNKGVTKQGVTDEGVTQYPALLYALTDPIKRIKLEKIYQSLRDFKQEKNVFYGYPDYGIPFDLVGEYLEVTK